MAIRDIELKLVAKANDGNLEAVGTLYAMHAAWVTRMALHYTGNSDDAEDVKHDTFIYLLSKFPGFALRAPLRSFLFPAIRHRSFSVMRMRRRTRPIVDDDSVVEAPHAAGDWDRLLELLPDHEREVISRRFGRGMLLGEIAVELEIPLGTVKSRLHKALGRLRSQLARASAAADARAGVVNRIHGEQTA